jgi:hypothetical protein
MGHRETVISLIGQTAFDEIEAKIPEKYRQEVVINYSQYLLTKSEQQTLDFYADYQNNTTHTSIPKMVGEIITFATHIHDLLKRIIEDKETDQIIKVKALKLDLHHMIIYCTSKYNIPNDYFIELMEFKHFRNMIGHNFNELMETPPMELMQTTAKGVFLVIVLVGILRGN